MIAMPEPDAATLSRRDEIIAGLRAIVPGEGVIESERERRVYESDALTAYRQLPLVVVLPETTAQVAAVLKYCHANNVRVVPRGAGLSYTGGVVPHAPGVVFDMAGMDEVTVVAKKGEQLKGELDELLDEIDSVLEENAEEFVRNYVQKGGE